mgnify:CR=1 FL=1
MEKRKISRSNALFFFGWAIAPLLLFACAGGKSVENNYNQATSEVMHDTLLHYIWSNDSVSRTDSVYHKDSVVYVYRNDSVMIDRWHTRYIKKWRNEVKTDTVRAYIYKYIANTDTIRQNKIEYKEVNRLTLWQQMRMGIGDILGVALIIYVLVLFIRLKV